MKKYVKFSIKGTKTRYLKLIILVYPLFLYLKKKLIHFLKNKLPIQKCLSLGTCCIQTFVFGNIDMRLCIIIIIRYRVWTFVFNVLTL